MADSFEISLADLRDNSGDTPDDFFTELESSGILPEARGDCTRTWGDTCHLGNGELGRKVTLTCKFKNPDGTTTTTTRTWCSSGSGE